MVYVCSSKPDASDAQATTADSAGDAAQNFAIDVLGVEARNLPARVLVIEEDGTTLAFDVRWGPLGPWAVEIVEGGAS